MTYGTTNKKHKNWRNTRRDFQYSENRHFPLIEKRFWEYPEILKEVNDIRGELGYFQSGHKEGGGSSNHAFISDPTAQIGIKHVEEIKKILISTGTVEFPERWIKVVELTLNYFKNEADIIEILRRRYFQNEPMATTCIDLDIKPEQYKQYYKARNAGIRYARDCAIQLGLIKVF